MKRPLLILCFFLLLCSYSFAYSPMVLVAAPVTHGDEGPWDADETPWQDVESPPKGDDHPWGGEKVIMMDDDPWAEAFMVGDDTPWGEEAFMTGNDSPWADVGLWINVVLASLYAF